MSTALAIAGVTQLLRDLLNDGLIDNDVAANIGTNVVVDQTVVEQVAQKLRHSGYGERGAHRRSLARVSRYSASDSGGCQAGP